MYVTSENIPLEGISYMALTSYDRVGLGCILFFCDLSSLNAAEVFLLKTFLLRKILQVQLEDNNWRP